MFPKSISNSSLEKEVFNTDSDYSKDFLQQRNSRTLSLRRNTKFLTIANFKKSESSHRNSNGSIPIISALFNQKSQSPVIEIEEFLEAFNSGDETKVIHISDMLIEIAESSNKDLQNVFRIISQSKEAGESYGMALSMAEDETLLHSLFNSLIYTFPLFSRDAKEEIINGGVTLKVDEILSNFCDQCNNDECSIPNINIFIDTCIFISVLSKNSTYARDSFLCYSVNERLLNMLNKIATALKQNQLQNEDFQLDDQSTLIICSLADAIQCIYTSKLNRVDNLNELITNDIINQMSQLLSILNGLNLYALKSIMACLISISSNYQPAVNQYFNNELDQLCISMLNEPELTSVALSLLGNMCNTADQNLLYHTLKYEEGELSLFQILIEMISTEYTADAFWIMSSLFDNLSNELMSYITPEFIQYVLSIGESSNFHIKKESTFFIATVITKVSAAYIPQFAESDELINTLIEMLSCDESKVIIRCFFAISYIVKALQVSQGTDAVMNVFCGTELSNQIVALKEEHDEIIKKISSFKDSTFEAIINDEEFLSALEQP